MFRSGLVEVFGMGVVLRARVFAAIAMVLVQLAAVLVSTGGRVAAQQVDFAPAAPNRYIVQLKEAEFTTASAVASSYDAQPGVAISHVYTNTFSGFAGEFSAAAAGNLADDPNVLAVFPDRLSTMAAQTMPPGIDRVDADLNPTVAGSGAGSVNVDIAILDTGIYQHSDLNVAGGKDCSIAQQSNQYNDVFGHGTHVAGSAAAIDNDDGVVGVAPGARLWAVKIFSDNGGGFTADSEVICGLDYVRGHGAIEVVNMSIGGYYGSLGGCNAHPYHQAICRLVNTGVTVVAAAGNNSDNTSGYVPAQFSEVITVSAYADTDGERGGTGSSSTCYDQSNIPYNQFDDSMACFSNYGTAVDIAAPGFNIRSTAAGGGTGILSGTSMASPHVAGAAALMRAQQGSMTPATVRARLIQSAEPGPLDGDPDSRKEPLLNVAELGKGKIVAPASGTVGGEIQVRISQFAPGSRAIFRFDGTYMGGDTVDDEGRAHRNFDIPAAKNGSHTITVSNGLKTVTKKITINESVRVSPTSGVVGDTVTVVLRGFASGESVTVRINTGSGTSTLVSNKVMSGTGSGNVTVDIPASTKGSRTITATGNKGNSATTTFNVKSSAYRSGGDPEPGNLVRIQFRGFTAGQTITFRYDTQSGETLGTTTASSTGSGSLAVRIPEDSSNGKHYIWVMSSGGNVRVTLTVSGAGLPPTPTPTATATATDEASATAEPTEEAPTEVPTDEPTEIPTEIPTHVPTEVATEIPTDEPTEVPTETPTDEPTEVPTEAPTDTPTEVVVTETPAE